MPRKKETETQLSIQDIVRSALENRATPELLKAKSDLISFAEYCFKDTKGNPIKLKDFHKQMLSMMEHKHRVLVLAPRGSGKSSLASTVFPLYSIMKNRDVRIIIVSNTIDLAREWLRDIERNMRENDEYQKLAGNDLIPTNLTWTETEKVVAGRSAHATHVTLKAVGVKGSLLGKRADIIIMDDVVDPENAATPYQRELVSAWFHQVLMPILEPDGKMIVIGTRFAREDLYEELWDSWTKVDENGNPYIDAGLAKIVAEPEPGVSYWPERFPYEHLHALKQQNSLMWWSQFMNEPVDLTGSFLRKEWLENYWEVLPDNPTYYIGMDPSVTGRGDNTGIVVVATFPKDSRIYVVDVFKEQADLKSQKRLLDMVCRMYTPALVNIESNASQQIITQYLEENSFIPIRQSLTKFDKPTRMANLAAHFNSKRILMRGVRDENGKLGPHPAMQSIFEEWVAFRPKDARDDVLDALEKAVEVVAYVGEAFDGGVNPKAAQDAVIQSVLGPRRRFRLLR